MHQSIPFIPSGRRSFNNKFSQIIGFKKIQLQCEADVVDKLIHTSAANNYGSDESGSLCANGQSKSSYLKILRI
jgi:hypothetical protein